MASKLQLKGKISAIRNIQQMTKAMQMVAAAKMRRAEEAALSARPYAKTALELLGRLEAYAAAEELQSRYFQGNEQAPAALVAVTSDKGLAGSYNANVLKLTLREKERMEQEGKQVEVFAVGKKARDFFFKRGVLAGEYLKFSDVTTLADASPLMDVLLRAFEEGRYSRIVFCSTQFVSAMQQETDVKQVLPIEREQLKQIVEDIVPKTGKYAQVQNQEPNLEKVDYLLEPSSQEIMESLLGELVRAAMFHLVLEANASEHSSRMVAMKNATENASSLRERLLLELNKARQQAITQEVAEISTAKEALMQE